MGLLQRTITDIVGGDPLVRSSSVIEPGVAYLAIRPREYQPIRMPPADSVAPKSTTVDELHRPRFVYPEQLTPDDLEAMDQVLDVDAEAYLRWLETGEGPDPCESCV
jgi:hypothetical protein